MIFLTQGTCKGVAKVLFNLSLKHVVLRIDDVKAFAIDIELKSDVF
jgi:hypothetical protein